ncbi:MAG TPA: lysylphosphatidylglycerol synthase transmembrane domain-containing protein [Ardenticatenaceae bacterium]|jgi:hypothetical protein
MKVPAALRRGFASTPARTLFGLALTLLTLYLAFRRVDIGEVWEVLAQAEGAFVVLALGSGLLNHLAKTLRWQVLLGEQRRSVSLWTLFSVLLMGQALNTLLPLRAGEVVRVYMVGGRGPGRSFTAGTIVLEKVLDMLSYTLLFFCSFSRFPSPPGRARPPIPSW